MVLAESVRKRSQCVDRKFESIALFLKFPISEHITYIFFFFSQLTFLCCFYALRFPFNPQHRETTGTDGTIRFVFLSFGIFLFLQLLY